jgi:hypothetical protein
LGEAKGYAFMNPLVQAGEDIAGVLTIRLPSGIVLALVGKKQAAYVKEDQAVEFRDPTIFQLISNTWTVVSVRPVTNMTLESEDLKYEE